MRRAIYLLLPGVAAACSPPTAGIGGVSPDKASIGPAPDADWGAWNGRPDVTLGPSAPATRCDVDITSPDGVTVHERTVLDSHGLPLWYVYTHADGRTFAGHPWVWRWAAPGVLASGYDQHYYTAYTNGRRTSRSDESGVLDKWAWDARGRLALEGHTMDAGEGPRDVTQYHWDDDGRMISQEQDYRSSGAITSHHWSDDGMYQGYTYQDWSPEDAHSESVTWTEDDDAGRPLHADTSASWSAARTGSSTGTEDWTWDDAGRPLDHLVVSTDDEGVESSEETTWTYTPTSEGGTRVDQLFQRDPWTSTESWTLDAEGRIVGHESTKGVETWTWYPDGHLHSATTIEGRTTTWSASCPDGTWTPPDGWLPRVLPLEASDMTPPTESLDSTKEAE